MENPKIPPDAATPPDRVGLRGTALVHFGPIWDATLESERERGKGPVAVLVCHGMGQQVRYETISSIAQAIRTEARDKGGAVSPVEVHLCQGNDGFLARAEVGWTDPGEIPHDVHVYEAYWAPLTEGKVTYWDTVKFLLLAAWNGLRYSQPFGPRTFQRWMFGGRRTMRIGPWTFFGLIVVLAFLLAQVAIISFVLLELAQQYKAVVAQSLPVHAGLPFWSHVGELLVSWLHWLGPFVPGYSFLVHPDDGHPRWLEAMMLLGWFAMVAEAFYVRYFLIEYVGDVAAYVSPYKDSKFDQLRQQIQKVGLDVGKVIYGFGAPQDAVPHYRKIVVVGHSLGSVLAYDTLDALINTDSVSAPADRRNVVARTRALITFGSPLDKTAFIFRMQPDNEQDWIREQMVASAQPLILDYPLYRPDTFRWVNIWSRMDIISGELNYYDDPDDPALTPNKPPGVVNMRDPKAWIPFYAHVQYWNNPRLREQLYHFVT
jgi:hypothetical protein